MSDVCSICLTIDLDPDGLNEKKRNRGSLDWSSLQALMDYLEGHRPAIDGKELCFSWMIRCDRQIEHFHGHHDYLFEKFADFWQLAVKAGDELCWHPHLYRQCADGSFGLMESDDERIEELNLIWKILSQRVGQISSFRSGEASMTQAMFDELEKLGLLSDSSAIPGYFSSEFGKDWRGAPNRPYFPAPEKLAAEGKARQMIELPMNSWYYQAPYDREPKLRYLNFAIHNDIFKSAMRQFPDNLYHASNNALENNIWVAVSHPEEMIGNRAPNDLYPRKMENVLDNIALFARHFSEMGKTVEFVTLKKAAELAKKVI